MCFGCRWESCSEILDDSSSLWQQSKEWLWIITQVILALCNTSESFMVEKTNVLKCGQFCKVD